MKNIKLMALTLMMGLMGFASTPAKAEIGYLDYAKILENYPAAQQAVKEIDAKQLELQQYMVDKERQYKSLDTPLKKQNFEAQTSSEFASKQEALLRLKEQKETQIFNQVQAVAKQIMVSQHLDAILADQVIFVGGVDITDLVLQRLKGQ